ncbi:MAG: DUF364 domain-containing protein [Synergistaceae bacterium]|nr:DUF364 domain-containing protein [Synergistaceae bacterium]
MRTITEDLIECGLSAFEGQRVEDVRIGLGYSAVKLNDERAGAACVLRHRLGIAGCSLLPKAGSLTGRAAEELLPLLGSKNVVETALALATLNALTSYEDADADSPNDDLVELLGIVSTDSVGMVGDISPVMRLIEPHAGKCTVFDEGKVGREGIADTSLEEVELPKCDVVILSATTLLNGTFEDVLAMSSNAREICVMGPSTPLLPEPFAKRGVTVLSGRRFTDPEGLLRIVSEAGGTKSFGRVSLKVNLRIK